MNWCLVIRDGNRVRPVNGKTFATYREARSMAVLLSMNTGFAFEVGCGLDVL